MASRRWKRPPSRGEVVAFGYDNRGNLTTETQVTAVYPTFTSGTRYRLVTDLSERGQIKSQTMGNGVIETANYDASTGVVLRMAATGLSEPPPSGCSPTWAPLVRQMDYTYDHFLNLAKQNKQFYLRGGDGSIQSSGCTPLGASASETYQYDDLQRLLGSTRAWVNMVPDIGTTFGDNYGYDDLGNITSKSDYGSRYTYGSQPRDPSSNAGPHAVASVAVGGHFIGWYNYDANGNVLSDGARNITFDKMDRPIVVTMNGVTTLFQYAPDGSRYLQRTTGVQTNKTVYYVDKDFERIDWATGDPYKRSYIGSSTIAETIGSTRNVVYRHLDRLGSSEAMTTGAPAAAVEFNIEAHGFDAFGKPRARDWQPSADKLHPGGDYGTVTELGFTQHEHLDDTFLIHMNGRMYDYRLGRFLSVDPIISNPANSQSINPYSYIGNNPLSGVDPTGYAPQDCLHFTGSMICNTAPAGSNLTINGIPVVGGNLNPDSPKQTDSGAKSQPVDTSGKSPHQTGAPSQTANATWMDKAARTMKGGLLGAATHAMKVGGSLSVMVGIESESHYQETMARWYGITEGLPAGALDFGEKAALVGMNMLASKGVGEAFPEPPIPAGDVVFYAKKPPLLPSAAASGLRATETAEAGAAEATTATTAFGRLVESFKRGDESWRLTSAHAESAISGAYKGATSIEEAFTNTNSGQTLVRHRIVRGDEVLHETYRPYAKFGGE